MSHQVKNLQRKSRNWNGNARLNLSKQKTLEAHVLLEISENANPLLIFERTTNLNELVKQISDQANLYAIENGRDFALNPKQIRAFLGINYIMPVSKLPNVKCNWSVVSHLSNDSARNAMTRNRLVNILQNLHFTYHFTKQLKNLTKLIRYALS